MTLVMLVAMKNQSAASRDRTDDRLILCGGHRCEVEPDLEGRSRGMVWTDSGERGDGLSQFVHTAACGPLGGGSRQEIERMPVRGRPW
jgi:hypothetical protein